MPLPLDLSANLLTASGSKAPAAGASLSSPASKDNTDGHDAAALGDQFSTLLNQALQKPDAKPEPKAAKPDAKAEKTAPDKAEAPTDEKPEAASLKDETSANKPAETADEKTSENPAADKAQGKPGLMGNLPANIAATLQQFFNRPAGDKPSEIPAPQAETIDAAPLATDVPAQPEAPPAEQALPQSGQPQAVAAGPAVQSLLEAAEAVKGEAVKTAEGAPQNQPAAELTAPTGTADAPQTAGEKAPEKSTDKTKEAPQAEKHTESDAQPVAQQPALQALNNAQPPAALAVAASIGLTQSTASQAQPAPVATSQAPESIQAVGPNPSPQANVQATPLPAQAAKQTAKQTHESAPSFQLPTDAKTQTASPEGNSQPAQAADTSSPTLPPPPETETMVKGDAAPTAPLTVSVPTPGSGSGESNVTGSDDGAPVIAAQADVNPAVAPKTDRAKSSQAFESLMNVQDKLQNLNGHVESHSHASQAIEQAAEKIQTRGNGEAVSETGPAAPQAPAADALPGSDTITVSATGASHGSQPTHSAEPLSFVSQAKNIPDQVVDGTAYSVKNGHKELIIRLNPDNLGEVKINLTSSGNNALSARLIASTPESHALLQNQIQTLKSSLEAHGIQLDRLNVVLAGSAADSGNNTRSDSEGNPQAFQQNQNQSHSSQRDFNQPGNQQAFQMAGGGFQQKSGFVQNPSYNNRFAGNGDTGVDIGQARQEGRELSNENGHISVLA